MANPTLNPPRVTDCVCANCCFFPSSPCSLSWKFYESNIASEQRDRSLERNESSMYVDGDLFMHHQSTIGPQKLKLLSEDHWGTFVRSEGSHWFSVLSRFRTHQLYLRLKFCWATQKAITDRLKINQRPLVRPVLVSPPTRDRCRRRKSAWGKRVRPHLIVRRDIRCSKKVIRRRNQNVE